MVALVVAIRDCIRGSIFPEKGKVVIAALEICCPPFSLLSLLLLLLPKRALRANVRKEVPIHSGSGSMTETTSGFRNQRLLQWLLVFLSGIGTKPDLRVRGGRNEMPSTYSNKVPNLTAYTFS